MRRIIIGREELRPGNEAKFFQPHALTDHLELILVVMFNSTSLLMHGTNSSDKFMLRLIV